MKNDRFKWPKTLFHERYVYLQLPNERYARIYGRIFDNYGLTYKRFPEYCIAFIDDFETFVMNLSQETFDSIERRSMLLMPIENKDQPKFSELKRLKSLDYWVHFFSQKALIKVIENQSISIFFQPILNLETGNIYGYHALTRGIDDSGALIPANDLFDTAKRIGLLEPLDQLCRETAIKRAGVLGIKEKLFINFMPEVIFDPQRVYEQMGHVVKESDLDDSQIILDVVETEFQTDFNHLNRVYKYYKNKGFKLALDEINCSFSLQYALVDVKPDYMKIDMDIIHDIHHNKENQMSLKNYLELSKSNDIHLLAEGIEKKEEMEYL